MRSQSVFFQSLDDYITAFYLDADPTAICSLADIVCRTAPSKRIEYELTLLRGEFDHAVKDLG